MPKWTLKDIKKAVADIHVHGIFSGKMNEFWYCDEIRVQKDCLIFCRIVNNLANIEYKVNKVVVGV